jgi:hypothetical protein
MVTAFTIFTIFSGVASLLGFAYIFFGSTTGGYKRLCAWCLGLAGVWSGYVALVPASTVERNVAAKISYYRAPIHNDKYDLLLVQKGEVELSEGCTPVEVQFSVPFREAPKVEVIDFKGYGDAPGVKATPFKAEFYRVGVGCFPHKAGVYRWTAIGPSLEEVSN